MTDVVSIERLAGALVAVGCVLAGLRFVLGRLNRVASLRPSFGGRRTRVLAVLETAYLPNAASLHLVRVDSRLLVLARSGGAVAMLCELESDARAHRG